MLPPDLSVKLRAADQFPYFQFTCDALGNADYPGFDTYLAVAHKAIQGFDGNDDFRVLDRAKTENPWLFGYLGYDLKNQVENLKSENPDPVGFPDVHFFAPCHLQQFTDGKWVNLIGNDLDEGLETATLASKALELKLTHATTREEYIGTVQQIRELILDGEVYEMNYCIGVSAKELLIDPIEVFLHLCEEAKMPFSTFLKLEDRYLICASPERFMQKSGNRLISQPIKGTVRRGKTTEEDALLKSELLNSEKERAENIMIVDLVRNDLNRSCLTGTVEVDRLLEVHTFRRLHHLISTVSGELRPEVSAIETIRNAFPMGSMTGAPKVSAMQMIEKLENRRRGLFSGAVGYFRPDGDFDFNVVIRSLFYNAKTRHLSLMIGSAITYDSDPAAEYEECLLKAQSLLKVLNQ